MEKRQVELRLSKKNPEWHPDRYSKVIETEMSVSLKSDGLASTPLFFSVTETSIIVTDVLRYQNQTLDARSLIEFSCFGFVSGNRTVYEGWFRVEAGTQVSIQKATGEISVEVHGSHKVIENKGSFKEAEEQCLQAIHTMFHRFCEAAKNRPLLIPLSGGRDARLLAVLAKDYGLDVQTYSYGREGSFEVNRAKNVAQYLKLPFHHVRLNPNSWDCFHDADIQTFLDGAFSATQTPQLIEAVSIKKLREQVELDPQTIVIPGHSGDLLGGSHIPELGKVSYSRDDLVQTVMKHHGRFEWPNKKDMPFIIEALESQFEDKTYTPFEYVEACENWNIKNRQSKFILGAAQAYDWAGLDWCVPLWDLEFEKTWRSLPLKFREGSRLYNHVLDEHFFKRYDIDFPEHIPITKTPIVKALKGCVPQVVYQGIKHKMKSMRRESVDYNAYQWLNDLLLKELPEPLPYSKREDHAVLTAWFVQVFLGGQL